MEFIGKFKGISTDWKSGETLITFSMDDKKKMAEVDKLGDAKLSIEAKKHREKRSIDANAFAWVLLGKIAEAIKDDKWNVYIRMLKRYSNDYVTLQIREDALERFKTEWRAVEDLGEVRSGVHQVLAFYGSHTFDSHQMATFIDGIISECELLDIETATPDELARMKSLWNQ